MPRQPARKAPVRRQFAALPLAREGEERRVLLVTSREAKRWVLPKGWPKKKLSGSELAAKEAFEEAGVLGQVETSSIGSYRYIKRFAAERTAICLVEVFPMQVEQILDDWPERRQRERQWFTLSGAASAVDEAELGTLLMGLVASAA